MGSHFSSWFFPNMASCHSLYPDRATNIELTWKEDKEETSITIVMIKLWLYDNDNDNNINNNNANNSNEDDNDDDSDNDADADNKQLLDEIFVISRIKVEVTCYQPKLKAKADDPYWADLDYSRYHGKRI